MPLRIDQVVGAECRPPARPLAARLREDAVAKGEWRGRDPADDHDDRGLAERRTVGVPPENHLLEPMGPELYLGKLHFEPPRTAGMLGLDRRHCEAREIACPWRLASRALPEGRSIPGDGSAG
jgi:hypothetical protein